MELIDGGRSLDPDFGTVDFHAPTGYLQVRKVSYRYPERTSNAVNNVTLSIPAYCATALVGESGAGKSTILRLITRFVSPSAGTIEIDGVDIATVSETSLRRSLSIVPQEPFLFEGTILENIRFGNPQAEYDDIVQAARMSLADDFILSLPQGYDTHVGERGTWLSGGQRQRIAVTRALIADSPVLVLDEATANIDPETECLIFEAINRYRRHKTVVVATHRLARVRDFDLIVVLREGHVVEQGTHHELMARGNYYYRMVCAEQDGAGSEDIAFAGSTMGKPAESKQA